MSGVVVGNFIHHKNTFEVSMIASIVSNAVMLLFIMLSAVVSQSQYYDDWAKDSEKIKIDNEHLYMFKQYRLREWMGVSREEFYETDRIAQLPMDFYYPGKAKQGDLPPRKGFAEKWHPRLLYAMPKVETIILIGNYSQKYYLNKRIEKNLTETVRNFKNYLPEYLPLVHPSPLNIGWLKRNQWFESDVVPVFKEIVKKSLL